MAYVGLYAWQPDSGTFVIEAGLPNNHRPGVPWRSVVIWSNSSWYPTQIGAAHRSRPDDRIRNDRAS